MLNVVEKKQEIYQMFDYIRDVYLKLFSNFLNESDLNRIKSYDINSIILDENREFAIKITNNLEFYLDIKKFIENNDLNLQASDLPEEAILEIKYLIDNQNDIIKIVKDELLEHTIQLFLKPKTPLEYGSSVFIADFISKKFNIPIKNHYKKEMELVEEIIKIVGVNIFFECLLNKDYDKLSSFYNQYCLDFTKNKTLEEIIKEINKNFNNYYKAINKVYYTDLLYYYYKIDYENEINEIKKIFILKEKIDDVMTKRILSIRECLEELNRYKIIFDEEEKQNLYYTTLNVNSFFRKNNNLLKNYNRAIEYEKQIKPLVNKVWNYYINFEGTYSETEQYYFLVDNYETNKDSYLKKTNLILNDNILLSDIDNRYQYGFIYKIKDDALIYSSPDKIIYKESENDNIYTIKNNDYCIEIENQIYSTLLTPRMLIIKTKENHCLFNTVLLDNNKIEPMAVYVVLNNDISLKKANSLSTKYNLPLITLKKGIYEK